MYNAHTQIHTHFISCFPPKQGREISEQQRLNNCLKCTKLKIACNIPDCETSLTWWENILLPLTECTFCTWAPIGGYSQYSLTPGISVTMLLVYALGVQIIIRTVFLVIACSATNSYELMMRRCTADRLFLLCTSSIVDEAEQGTPFVHTQLPFAPRTFNLHLKLV